MHWDIFHACSNVLARNIGDCACIPVRSCDAMQESTNLEQVLNFYNQPLLELTLEDCAHAPSHMLYCNIVHSGECLDGLSRCQ